MATIAVIGPGAIGGTVAVRLQQEALHSVTLCARSHPGDLTIETSVGRFSMSPTVLTAPQQGRPCDWVFVATKAYDAASAGAWLPHLVDRETRVAVLQNGVEHIDRFRPYVPEDQIVPVVVSMPVQRLSPGHFRQHGRGQLTVGDTRHGRDFARLFLNSGIEVVVATDFRAEAWAKLALNCAGAVPALVLKTAMVSRIPAIAEIMEALVCECITVGRAEGVELDDCLIQLVLSSYQTGPADAVNSLHADRLAGRQLEIDARNGAVVRLGCKHGIDTPINRMIVALLEAAL